MMSFIRPRWRRPAVMILAGAAFAAAWGVRGGPHWSLWATLFGIIAVARAGWIYLLGGEDADAGALAGSRADERQKVLDLRSWAFSGRFAMLASFVGLTVAVAVKATWWWPFLAIFAVTCLGYGLRLMAYMVRPGN
jgi:hypothetical protein